MIAPEITGFTIAPFSPAGPLTEPAFCGFSILSPEWVANCRTFLREHGPVFQASWGQPLGNISTKLTSSDGAGLGTFFLDQKPILFTHYLSGLDEDIDADVTAMFTEMIRNILTLEVKQGPGLLRDIPRLSQRPLLSVFVMPNDRLGEEDFNMIRELSTHFAAAFFQESFSLTPFKVKE